MSAPSRKFPPELLQKIRDSVNITDVVGEHVVLRKTGANFVGLCPFHSERSPSFSVSENKQLYHCYGCKKGGDLINFVMEIHGISFPEAVEELADRARIAMPKELSRNPSGDPEAEKRREAAREKSSTAYKLNRFVAAFYHNQLKSWPDAENYLRKRGVSDLEQRQFYLGAAPGGWDALTRHLADKKAPVELAVELGLIRPSNKGQGHFDLFRNRVMFPILDMRGKVAGFGGRTMPGTVGGEDGPKYLNSAESFLFQKGKLAYGLYQAQKHIREKDEVILVEGYFDVLALHAAGFQNVVASCGTALTPDHLAIFRRFASRITLLFDGDRAGIDATERSMELGLEHGLILNGAVMPEDLDPDEILFDDQTGSPRPEGKARMEEILKAAQPLLDARLEAAISKSHEGPEAKTQAIKQIAAWLARYTDAVGREVRIEAVINRMGVSRDLLEQAMGAGRGRSRSAPPANVGGGHAPPPMGHPGGPGPRAQNRPSAGVPVGPPSAGRMPNRPPRQAFKVSSRLNPGEKMVLAGLVRGGDCDRYVVQAGGNLPPDQTIADLFDYEPARLWVQERLQASLGGTDLSQFRGLSVTPDILTQAEIDPQLRSTLMEALVETESPFSVRDFQVALDRAIGRSWARFSQRIKAALVDAEAKKDAGLYARLSQEYLDVQRKMKEFNSFYDEA